MRTKLGLSTVEWKTSGKFYGVKVAFLRQTAIPLNVLWYCGPKTPVNQYKWLLVKFWNKFFTYPQLTSAKIFYLAFIQFNEGLSVCQAVMVRKDWYVLLLMFWLPTNTYALLIYTYICVNKKHLLSKYFTEVIWW